MGTLRPFFSGCTMYPTEGPVDFLNNNSQMERRAALHLWKK